MTMMTSRFDPQAQKIRAMEDEIYRLRRELDERRKDRMALDGYDEPRLGMMFRAEIARADYFEELAMELEEERWGSPVKYLSGCARTTEEPRHDLNANTVSFDLLKMGRLVMLLTARDYRQSSPALVEKDAWNIANQLARGFLPAIRNALHLGYRPARAA